MRRFVYWLAAADVDRVGRATVERARYVGTGLALMLTAVLAAATMSLLLWQITGSYTAADALIAGLWAAVVLNVDRLLVANFHYGPLDEDNDGQTPPVVWWKAAATYGSRLLLAVLIAYSVAEPAMLVLFHSEIVKQLDDNKAIDLKSAEIQVRAQHAGEIADADQALKVAQDRATDAGNKADQARTAFDLEVNGQGGTRVVGCSKRADGACEMKRRAWIAAEAEREATTKALAQATTTHTAASDNIEGEIRQEVEARKPGIDGNNGFLASSAALDQVIAANPGLNVRRLALTLLVVVVDLLPVLIKLFGPPTLHDRAVRRAAIEESLIDREATLRGRRTRAANEQRRSVDLADWLEIELDKARHRKEYALATGNLEHRRSLHDLGRRYAGTVVVEMPPADESSATTDRFAQAGAVGTPPSESRASATPSGALVLNGRWIMIGGHPPDSGTGGMGETWLANDRLSPTTEVVVKRVRRADGDGAGGKLAQQFEKELRRHSAVQSEYVAPVLDTGNHPDFGTFIVTQLYPDTLARRLRASRSPHGGFNPDLQWSLRITEQVLLGLVDCWQQGIVHLDIKPANIALDKDDAVRLIDFGLAKVSPGLQDQASTGIPAFTWFYAPPEQIARKPRRSWWSSACDVRACGATLYAILTGVPPMRREAEDADLLTPAGDIDMFHAREMLELLTNKLPAPPSAFLPKLPPEVDELVMTMLQPMARDRYRDVTAALTALRDVTALIQDTAAEYMPVGWRAVEFPPMSQDGES